MADIMNGRYALADPDSGLTVLSLEGGELNMFGSCTRIRTTQRDFYPQIQDEPTELEVENHVVAQLVTGLVVAAALAAVAVAVVVTGGLAMAPLACALGGAAIGAGAVAIGTAVSDSETGYNRSWGEYWERLVTGSCIGFAAGAAVYGLIAAVPAAASAAGVQASMMLGTSTFTAVTVPGIVTVGGYGLAGAGAVYTANDIYSNSRGYNIILDKVFDDNIEAYEAAGMVLDLFAEMYTNLGESNRALGNRSDNDAGQPGEEPPKKPSNMGDNDSAAGETAKENNIKNTVDNGNVKTGTTKDNSVKNPVDSDHTAAGTTQGNSVKSIMDNKGAETADGDAPHIEIKDKIDNTVDNFNKDQRVINNDAGSKKLDSEGVYFEGGNNHNDNATDKNSTNNSQEKIVQRYASNQVTNSDSTITVSGKKMWQLGNHYNKHGRLMGYQSSTDYDMAAKEFAKNMQNDPGTKIFEGKWNGKGKLNGTMQRAITNNNKTVIINVDTGQVIDFYMGSDYGGLINMKQIK